MNRPMTHTQALMPPHVSRRIVIAVAAVIVIHVALIYAFTSGLAGRIVRELPHVINAEIVKAPPPKQHPVAPPPKPVLVKPTQPVVPPPLLNIRTPPAPRAITQVRRTLAPPPRQIRPAPPPAPPAPKPVVVPPTPAAPIVSTHTIPPYPPFARRLAQEGTVLLRLSIGTDGHVTGATVIRSSGHSRLDEAAQLWVKAHWRYRPATRNGQPIPSQVEARVVFNLSQARP